MTMDKGPTESRVLEQSNTVIWNPDGPTVPGIIPFVFFLVLTVTILLYLYKVLKKYYDKQAKSDTYVFVDHESDDTARLKKIADDDDIANSPTLNSLKHTSDGRGSEPNRLGSDEVRVEVANAPEGDLMQVDGASPSAPEGPVDFSENVSGTETLPLNKKKTKLTESNV